MQVIDDIEECRLVPKARQCITVVLWETWKLRTVGFKPVILFIAVRHVATRHCYLHMAWNWQM